MSYYQQLQYRGRDLELQVGDAVLYRGPVAPGKLRPYLAKAVRIGSGTLDFSARPIFQECPVNHTAIVSVNGLGELMLNEAVDEGIISRPARLFLERPGAQIVVRRNPRTYDPDIFAARVNAKIGTPYDYESLIYNEVVYRVTIAGSYAIHKLSRGRWTPRPIWNGFTGDKASGRLQCAEYYAWAHELPDFWVYSSKEILEHPALLTVFNELIKTPYK